LGFGLIVIQERWVSCKVFEASGISHSLKWKRQIVGWYWWDKLNVSYILSLGAPENIIICKASMENRILLNDFHDEMEKLVADLDLKDNFSIWA
jgi:hypothetical protein